MLQEGETTMLKKFYNLKIYQKITLAFASVVVLWFGVLLYFVIQTNHLINDLTYLENAHNITYVPLSTGLSNSRRTLEFIHSNIFVAAFIIITFILIVGKLLSNSISKPINKMVGVIKAISAGELNVDIPESGDSEVGSLAKAARVLKEDLSDLIEDINKFKDEIVLKGNIDYRFIETAYEGSYREMAVALNSFKESMTTDVIEVINFVNSIEAGDFDVGIQELPGKKIIITLCLRSLIQNLKDISREIENVMSGTKAKIDVKKYSGEWRKIMIELNKFIELNECIGCDKRTVSRK